MAFCNKDSKCMVDLSMHCLANKSALRSPPQRYDKHASY